MVPSKGVKRRVILRENRRIDLRVYAIEHLAIRMVLTVVKEKGIKELDIENVASLPIIEKKRRKRCHKEDLLHLKLILS
jgi:hypothetical protein